MIRRSLAFNYPGIILTIVTVLISYFLLSHFLKKTEISEENRKLIISVEVILIIVVSFFLKLLVYKEICVEVGDYAGVSCSKELFF